MQSKSWQPTSSTFEQQTLHTSMAGVDGSLVMVGEAITSEGEEVEMPPQKKEMFVLLDNVPQASDPPRYAEHGSPLLLYGCSSQASFL